MLKLFSLIICALAISAPALALQDISKMSDDEFLDMIERDSVMYYVDRAHPKSGLIAYDAENTHVGSNGFAMNAFIIGAERKYITREKAAELTLKMLETWKSVAANHLGVFQWMTDAETATKGHAPSFDMVETAYICAGALTAKQYFDGASETEQKIRVIADEIYQRVEFDKYTIDATGKKTNTLAWGYETDNKRFSTLRINGLNECMIIYILAIGSPKHAAPPSTWHGWAESYAWRKCYGYSYIFCAPMFAHQYSQCWLDLRDLQDKYTKKKNLTYFENSRRAALSHKEYAKQNPKKFPNYGPLWGLTDCGCPLHPSGFGGHGLSSAGYVDDGTIAVSAAGASIMFTPKESIEFLRTVYSVYGESLYDKHGFRNAFNVKSNWVDPSHDMLNKGAMLTSIENYRSGLIWKLFMKNPEIQLALKKAGFKKAVLKPESAAASAKYVASDVIDGMDDAEAMNIYTDNGTSANPKEGAGKVWNCLEVEYDMGKGNWAGLSRAKEYNLMNYDGIQFYYKTSGAINRLEVKLEDADGTVFGYIVETGLGANGWTLIQIPFDEMWYWWGGNRSLDQLKAKIVFAITREEGGAGTVCIDDIRGIVKGEEE